jgi:uncharacterized protein
MSKALPERIYPLRLAHHGESLAGSVLCARMPRLAELLHEGRGRVDFELRFGYDDGAANGGQACVLGRIDARLEVICQRCLEPMDILVGRDVRLAVLREDAEVASLDAAFEPLLIGDEPIALSGLLEDELILAMPDFSRHPSGECEMPPGADTVHDSEVIGAAGEGPHRDTAGKSGKDNPFRVLESIKSRKTP